MRSQLITANRGIDLIQVGFRVWMGRNMWASRQYKPAIFLGGMCSDSIAFENILDYSIGTVMDTHKLARPFVSIMMKKMPPKRIITDVTHKTLAEWYNFWITALQVYPTNHNARLHVSLRVARWYFSCLQDMFYPTSNVLWLDDVQSLNYAA